MTKYEDNYQSYLDYYYKKIREKYPNYTDENIANLIRNLEVFYSSLPIMHSTSVDKIDAILREGLKSYNMRSSDNRKDSSIFDIDIKMGLSNYAFANIGRIPIYGSDKNRVTLLLSDDVCTEDNYFTFIDIAQIYHFGDNDIYSIRERSRILSQYTKSILPLNKLWNILSLNALASRRGIEDDNYFPFAIDPDFIHQNGGIPEIKIANYVEPDKIIGFIVEGSNSSELRRALEAKGINSECILQLGDNNDKYKKLIEFKQKLLETYKKAKISEPEEVEACDEEKKHRR